MKQFIPDKMFCPPPPPPPTLSDTTYQPGAKRGALIERVPSPGRRSHGNSDSAEQRDSARIVCLLVLESSWRYETPNGTTRWGGGKGGRRPESPHGHGSRLNHQELDCRFWSMFPLTRATHFGAALFLTHSHIATSPGSLNNWFPSGSYENVPTSCAMQRLLATRVQLFWRRRGEVWKKRLSLLVAPSHPVP